MYTSLIPYRYLPETFLDTPTDGQRSPTGDSLDAHSLLPYLGTWCREPDDRVLSSMQNPSWLARGYHLPARPFLVGAEYLRGASKAKEWFLLLFSLSIESLR